jgi:hypothetical protein
VYDECPECGVITAKFYAREDAELHEMQVAEKLRESRIEKVCAIFAALIVSFLEVFLVLLVGAITLFHLQLLVTAHPTNPTLMYLVNDLLTKDSALKVSAVAMVACFVLTWLNTCNYLEDERLVVIVPAAVRFMRGCIVGAVTGGDAIVIIGFGLLDPLISLIFKRLVGI